MSDSNLKLPSTTELEGRVREALKVANHCIKFVAETDLNDPSATPSSRRSPKRSAGQS